MTKLFKYTAVLLLLVLLVLVRVFEKQLFYDPFIDYFKHDYLLQKIPDFHALRLFFNHLFRYSLNAVISMGVLFLLFNDKRILKVTATLFVAAFVLLTAFYFFALKHWLQENYLITFYLRRFLIQPLFLFIFLVAFYYHKRMGKG